MKTKTQKALVLYSGGLDSRLVVKIMLEQGFEVVALHFLLPFGCNCVVPENESFVKDLGAEFRVIDVTKKPLLDEYLDAVENAKFGYGAGYNPCADCKVWIFKKAKKMFDVENFDVFATGEVLGQRPMSQTNPKRKKIDEAVGFDILRPLSAKNLPETEYEKNGLVDRNKLYEIEGRRRVEQIELANKWNLEYPTPGGGCLLCEKVLEKRFRYLIENGIVNGNNLFLLKIGRHFVIDDVWFVVSRDGKEGDLIVDIGHLKSEVGYRILEGGKGLPEIFFNDVKGLENAKKLQAVYGKGVNEEERKKFDKFKL